jgi:hypothetical protein
VAVGEHVLLQVQRQRHVRPVPRAARRASPPDRARDRRRLRPPPSDVEVNATAPVDLCAPWSPPDHRPHFDFVDCTVSLCTDDQNTLIVSSSDVADPDVNQMWYVLVVANSAGSLHVWNAAGGACASDCNGHGQCDATVAKCKCDDDYASFDCLEPKSALERWEWALIIGGAVLVAIGLIGCIVYFIQRQSRRAGFERV